MESSDAHYWSDVAEAALFEVDPGQYRKSMLLAPKGILRAAHNRGAELCRVAFCSRVEQNNISFHLQNLRKKSWCFKRIDKTQRKNQLRKSSHDPA